MARRRAATDTLLVYTKLPVVGHVKTRLAAETGPERAAGIHAEMVALTLRECAMLAAGDGTRVEVRADAAPRVSRAAFSPARGIAFATQGTGDLGARLERGLAAAFARGARRVCAIGTDCPDLDATLLRRAFAALGEHDAVIGPADDGGYYLIGLAAGRADLLPALFCEVPWSNEKVAEVTRERLADARAVVATLPALSDVDYASDLAHWERVREKRTGPPETISVIVAAKNEEGRVADTLRRVIGIGGVDVTLVDGGSTDGTAAIARSLDVAVLEAVGGRAAQLATGAQAATGGALLFLHADTLLPDGWATEVRRVLADPDVMLGAFRFATDSTTRTLRLLERGTDLRARWGLPYGDQAQFLRATTYRSLGGLPRWPLMEDYDLARRARAAGRVEISPLAAVTSARRWEEHGPWRWTALNMLTAARFEAGASPEELAEWRTRVLGKRNTRTDHSKR